MRRYHCPACGHQWGEADTGEDGLALCDRCERVYRYIVAASQQVHDLRVELDAARRRLREG